MKRLKPIALSVTNAGELKLRCKPKLQAFTEEEQADILLTMSQKAVNAVDDKRNLEAEFSFTFNETGAVLHDQHFFALTYDDYSELWIKRSVNCFSEANKGGVAVADSPTRLKPYMLLVDEENNESTRKYKVFFGESSASTSRDYTFTVQGKGNRRTITWSYGGYTAIWEKKKWTFDDAFPAQLQDLFLAIIRLDEAIHFELMPYATATD